MENIKGYDQMLESSGSSEYDKDRLYFKENIVKRMKNAPGYIRDYIKELPDIRCRDASGKESTCTKIPQFVWQYLFRNF